MQRQQIVQRATRSKQNMEDTSFYIIKHEPSYMFHKRSKQKRRDEKHMHISHANTGIKQQHFTQTARHVTIKYEVTKI
jgi:hypothetical protein